MKKIKEMNIEKTLLFWFAVAIIVNYAFSFFLIFTGRILEGALLLIAISIADKVNEDRFQ